MFFLKSNRLRIRIHEQRTTHKIEIIKTIPKILSSKNEFEVDSSGTDAAALSIRSDSGAALEKEEIATASGSGDLTNRTNVLRREARDEIPRRIIIRNSFGEKRVFPFLVRR